MGSAGSWRRYARQSAGKRGTGSSGSKQAKGRILGRVGVVQVDVGEGREEGRLVQQ